MSLIQLFQEVGSITIERDNPFILRSGIESPVYCDMRSILSNSGLRNTIIERF